MKVVTKEETEIKREEKKHKMKGKMVNLKKKLLIMTLHCIRPKHSIKI